MPATQTDKPDETPAPPVLDVRHHQKGCPQLENTEKDVLTRPDGQPVTRIRCKTCGGQTIEET